MSNLRTLIWYFYKPLLILNLAFSLGYIAILSKYGLKVFAYGFFFKLLGYASTTFLQGAKAKNSYMYYRNAGYGIRHMYAYAYAVDMAIYITLLALYFLLR